MHSEIRSCLLVFIVVDYLALNYVPLCKITAVNQNKQLNKTWRKLLVWNYEVNWSYTLNSCYVVVRFCSILYVPPKCTICPTRSEIWPCSLFHQLGILSNWVLGHWVLWQATKYLTTIQNYSSVKITKRKFFGTFDWA